MSNATQISILLGGWAGDIEMVKREETVGFARVSLWLTLPQPDILPTTATISYYCQPLLLATVAAADILPTSNHLSFSLSTRAR